MARVRPPSRKWLWAAVALGLLAPVVVTGLLFDPSPGSSTLPNPPCRAVLIVGLRGNGDSLDQDHGMGGDVWAVAERLTARLAGRVDAGLAAFPYSTGPPWGVVQHATTASKQLSAYLVRRHLLCPAERLVLLGQSEGAAVVHLALPTVNGALVAAVLLADAARVAGTAYDTLATGWNGALAPLVLSSRWTLQGPAVQDNLPPGMTDRVRSYCLAGDAVCNFSPGALPQLVHSSVHTSYRRNPDGIADAAANFAAARVAADLGFSRGG